MFGRFGCFQSCSYCKRPSRRFSRVLTVRTPAQGGGCGSAGLSAAIRLDVAVRDLPRDAPGGRVGRWTGTPSTRWFRDLTDDALYRRRADRFGDLGRSRSRSFLQPAVPGCQAIASLSLRSSPRLPGFRAVSSLAALRGSEIPCTGRYGTRSGLRPSRVVSRTVAVLQDRAEGVPVGRRALAVGRGPSKLLGGVAGRLCPPL